MADAVLIILGTVVLVVSAVSGLQLIALFAVLACIDDCFSGPEHYKLTL